jgi:tetratricopeptide (TPR) repeat protein
VAEPPARGKAAPVGVEDILKRARDAMDAGKIEESLGLYAGLIKKKRQLNAVIRDLQSATDRGSMPPAVWQALGDAYMKADRLNEAIESYRHGLEAV